MKSIFISLEGPEGAGKSTVLQAILPYLSESRKVVGTREPGGDRIAEDIRRIILDPQNVDLDGKSEMLLFAAARRVHWLNRIKPALEAGQVVLVDRFIDSSVAYQGYAAGLDISQIKWLNDFATDETRPDLTLFFDLEPELGLNRVMKDAKREKNRLDLAQLDYHKRVMDGYRKLAVEEADRFVQIDASQTPEEVKSQALELIMNRFPGEF